jgi:predicted secreted hydrolase
MAIPRACSWLLCGCISALPLCLASSANPATDVAETVAPGMPLHFPRDFGSHPRFAIEWWYLTGWLYTQQRQPLGFEITFFRVRRQLDAPNPSAFAPGQVLIAHVALSDPQHARLWQEQRIRRAGLGLVQAAEADTNVRVDDWRLQREPWSAAAAGAAAAGAAAAGAAGSAQSAGSRYFADVQASDFALQLQLTDRDAPVPNGRQGFSQKGPQLHSASDYYSEPHLSVTGEVLRGTHHDSVRGEAWLDHEWASEYLDPAAQGWDWVGLNLDDGGSLMAFQIRDRQGHKYWGGGTLRDAEGHIQILTAAEVQFQPLRRWRSPRSGVSYPVAELVQAGARRFWLEPLLDDQEFDARASSGALYWEGAVRARDDPSATRVPAGRGYLELTGYDRPLSLR